MNKWKVTFVVFDGPLDHRRERRRVEWFSNEKEKDIMVSRFFKRYKTDAHIIVEELKKNENSMV